MIQVTGISKQFTTNRQPLTVFENLSLQIEEGETVCILGPSGCGKSTFLRCAAGLIDYRGEILIDNSAPKDLINAKKIGFMFQDSGLIPWHTVFQNVKFPSTIGKHNKTEIEVLERADRLLKIIGLSSYKDFYPHQLSGGMKQRTSVARTLLLTPRVIMLDEPFASIDALTRLKLIIELNAILRAEKVTTIMVTHSLEEAALMADRIIIMSKRPATIISTIRVNYSTERNMELFETAEFTSIVNQCRKTLFANEN
jgi:NitT/TauT family transport system ATP-binding protein